MMHKAFHPNGFLIRTLLTFWNGARLRIHTWDGNQSDRLDPHDHRTWFISIPLYGVFVEQRFEEIDGNTPIFKCRSTTRGGRLDIQREGQGGLRVIKTITRYPFIPYFVSKEDIHSFRPKTKSFVATLVLFGPPTNKSPRAWIAEEYL
jgi:hypothetical protein